MNKLYLGIVVFIHCLPLAAMEEKRIIAQGADYTFYIKKSGKRIFEAKSFEPNFHGKVYNQLVGSRRDIFVDKQGKEYSYFLKHHPETPTYILEDKKDYVLFITKQEIIRKQEKIVSPLRAFAVKLNCSHDKTEYERARNDAFGAQVRWDQRIGYGTWQDMSWDNYREMLKSAQR